MQRRILDSELLPPQRLGMVVEQDCAGGNSTTYHVDLMDTQVLIYGYDGKFIDNFVFDRNY